MVNLNFVESDVNKALRAIHERGLSVVVRVNGWPVQLKENELLQLSLAINDCTHEWVELEFLGRRIKGTTELTVPVETYTVCNLCGMTK